MEVEAEMKTRIERTYLHKNSFNFILIILID